MSKITEFKRPSILLLILGITLTLIGFTILLNPQDNTTNNCAWMPAKALPD